MRNLKKHKLVVATVFAICAALIAGALGVNAGASSGASAPAPDWLQGASSRVIPQFTTSATVTDAVWAETTWGQYEQAVGGNGDRQNGNGLYVVVVHGNFTWELAKPAVSGESAPAAVGGTVLVFTFDAATKDLGSVALLHSEAAFDEEALGPLSQLALPQ